MSAGLSPIERAKRKLADAKREVLVREAKPLARIDVRHAGEPFPSWPDKRPQDRWLVIDLAVDTHSECGSPPTWDTSGPPRDAHNEATALGGERP